MMAKIDKNLYQRNNASSFIYTQTEGNEEHVMQDLIFKLGTEKV